MNRRNSLMLCILAVVLPLSALSCSKKSQTKGKIGMTCMDLTNPFFKLIADVMQAEAATYGYELIALSGELDAAKQNN